MQISSNLFCAIGFIGKNIAVLQIRKQLQQRNCLRTIINISGKQLIPAVAGYTGTLADAVVACKNAGVEATAQKELLAEISGLLAEMKTAREKLMELDEKAVAIADPKEQAFFYKY